MINFFNIIAPRTNNYIFKIIIIFDNFKKKSELYEFTIERTPMRRWGESEEVANSCLFLASSLSSYVTGDVINVDGGWSAW